MNKKRYLSIFFALIVLGWFSACQAAGDADDFYELKVGGKQALKILESLPWASEGEGPVMYFFEYSECPYCQAMYRDFNGKDVGIEFRRMFVPVSKRSDAETMAMVKSRSNDDYHAYMEGRKRAPKLDNDREAVEGRNAIVIAGTKDLPKILKQNGWPLKGFAFPQYFWVENGKVFANAGYAKASLEKAILRAKRGAVVKTSKKRPVKKVSTAKSKAESELRNAAVGGIKLGMSPAQVQKALEGSPKNYRVDSRKLSVHGQNFVATMTGTLPITDTALMKQLGGGASDSIGVHFAPPPHENVAIMIYRLRNFGLNEQAPPEKVEQAVINKYGKPDTRPAGNYKNETVRRYLWRKTPSICDRHAKGHYLKFRDYLFKDQNWISRVNDWNGCPTFLFVAMLDGLNPKTRKRDHIYTMNSYLIDYPVIVQAYQEMSDVTRKINEKESAEREKRSAPSDI